MNWGQNTSRRSFLRLSGAGMATLSLPGALAACAAPSGAMRWDMSVPWSLREFHTQNAMRFADAVEKATSGRLDIRVHAGAVLGIKGGETVRVLGERIVDMAEFAGFQEVGSIQLLGLESLPFLVSDHDDLARLYTLLRQPIEAELARHNLKALYIVPWPNQNIYTKVRTDRLSDLQGLKIRTYDRGSSELMARLGLIPVQLPSQDVVPALASGLIDAVMTSTTTGAAQKYWEFLDYIYRTNHIWISNIMAVNLDAWSEIGEEDRQTIENLAQKLEPEFWRVSRNDDLRQLEVLLNNGMQAIEPTAEMMQEMRLRAAPMWQEFAARVGGRSADIISAFTSHTASGTINFDAATKGSGE